MFNRKEYCKQYYQLHKKEILQKRKLYWQDNKNRISFKKKEYYLKNKDRILTKQKEYYLKNRNAILKRYFIEYWNNRPFRLKRPPLTLEQKREYQRLWYDKNRERINAKRRELRKLRKTKKSFAEIFGLKSKSKEYNLLYYIFNRDKLLQQKKKYWEERGKEIRKIYKLNNKEKIKKLYQSRKNGLTIDKIQEIYEDNIKRYNTLTCEYCKSPIQFGNDTLEHKIPISRGGTNDKENLCIACKRCNFSKQDKTPEEFLQYLNKTKEVINA